MNMKLYKILSTGALALAMASCTDLDVDMDSLYSALPGTESAVEANMANIYFQFRDPLGRRYMEAMTLSSDEYTSVAYSGNWYDGLAYAHPSYHNSKPSDATIDWMGVFGLAVVKANEVINSDADANYIAAARTMRAFYTFLMMDNFGDVAIVDQKYADEKGIDMETRQPRGDVARWLESELLDVIPQLSTETKGESYGKPNKYMAQALLAKIYINWAVYTAPSVDQYDAASASNEKLADCIKVCDEIINSHVFELGPDAYRFKFNWDNTERVEAGTIKDFIYAMPYDTYTATGMQWGRSHVYKDIKNMNPSYFGEKLNNSGGAYMTLTPECVERFNLPGDERNFLLAGHRKADGSDANGVVYVYDPVTLLPTDVVAKDKQGNDLILTKTITVTGDVESNDVGDNLEGWRQGYRSMKWFVCDRDYSNGRHQSNDVPIFRYADVLLIKAEALVRSGQSGAKDLFNQIRSYVNAPTLSGEPSLNDIYEERGREFFDELWRRNDMIRFGHFEDEYFPQYKSNSFANFDKTHRIFPISQNDLNLNPKWEQNPGY
ncbi:MAG: RagB/SusD family nutrient uptake outer membrane protein [Bacteroidales bacterium]|nr:RagB/SusD family nutrient uptake outer membrane protein [Bacteroidales bacterium]